MTQALLSDKLYGTHGGAGDDFWERYDREDSMARERRMFVTESSLPLGALPLNLRESLRKCGHFEKAYVNFFVSPEFLPVTTFRSRELFKMIFTQWAGKLIIFIVRSAFTRPYTAGTRKLYVALMDLSQLHA